MSRAFTSGKHAKAICDRCGDKVNYKDLHLEWTGLLVCHYCLDSKTGQEFPTHFPVDSEALENPRPDNDVEAGRGVIRVEPLIGSSFKGYKLTAELGSVTVSVT